MKKYFLEYEPYKEYETPQPTQLQIRSAARLNGSYKSRYQPKVWPWVIVFLFGAAAVLLIQILRAL